MNSRHLPTLKKLAKDPQTDDVVRLYARVYIAGLTGKGVRLSPEETYIMTRDAMLSAIIDNEIAALEESIDD